MIPIKGYCTFDPLKTAIVGDVFPIEKFKHIREDKVLSPLARVIDETKEDLENLSNTLKKFGVEVHRPNMSETADDLSAYRRKPPQQTRDDMAVVGEGCFVANNLPEYHYIFANIDSDKMYDLVTKWAWGNGDLTTIYHDPETRKNSISYRTNMARLMEQLINEGKTAKAKNIIDLALTKMPMDYYGYSTMVEPFAGGYYEVGEKAKARQLLEKLMTKYKQSLLYYSGIQPSIQNGIATDIITDIERYRSLLTVMKDRGDMEFYNKNKPIFNSFVQRFTRFGRELE
jgi:hypothetical protein